MASTRELWVLLRARDEASRVLNAFSKNVRSAGLSARAAAMQAQAAAIRQRAQMVKTDGDLARQATVLENNIRTLDNQSKSIASSIAVTKQQRDSFDQTSKAIQDQITARKEHATLIDKEARELTLQSAILKEQRDVMMRTTGTTNDQMNAINRQITALDRRAQVLRASASVERNLAQSELNDLNARRKAINDYIKDLERQADVAKTSAASQRGELSKLRAEIDAQVISLNKEADALDMQANKLRIAASEARVHEQQMARLRASISKVSEVATVGAVGFGALGAAGVLAMKSAIDASVEYEKQTRLTFTQVDKGKGTLQEVHDVGIRVAKDIGVAFEEIQPALFDVFSSTDANVTQAEALLRSFAKAAVAGQTDITSASRATIGIMNAFAIPLKNVNHVLDIQFELVKEGIGSYEEWVGRIGSVSPSAVRAGQDLNTMAAALVTTTRFSIPAAKSATAVGRAFDAFSNPKAVEALKEIGVKATDAKGNFRPFVDVMKDFKKVLDKMPGGQEAKIGAILNVFKGAGSTIEARKFLQSLLLTKDGLQIFEEQLGNMEGATGSFESAYSEMASTTATQSEILRNKWMILKESIGKALIPAFMSVIDFIEKLLDKFNKLPQSTKDTIAKFILFGSIISIGVGAVLGLIAALAFLVTGLAAAGGEILIVIGIIAGLGAAIVGIGAAFVEAYKKSDNFRALIESIKKFATDAKKDITDFVASVVSEIKDKMMPAFIQVRDYIENKLLPTLKKIVDWLDKNLLPKLREAGRIAVDVLGMAFGLISATITNVLMPALKMMGDWWDKNKAQIMPWLNIMLQVIKYIAILAAIIVGVLAVAFGTVLVGTIVAAIAIFAAIIGIVSALTIGFKYLWKGLKELGDLFATVGKAIWAAAKTIGEGFAEVFKWIDGMSRKIADFWSNLWKKVTSFASTITNAIGNAANLLLQTGKDVVQGFINGITSKFGEITSAAKGMVNSLTGAVKNLLGIASPSKVFASIGKAVGVGFRNGLLGTKDKIVSTVANIISRIKDISASAAKRVQNAINKPYSQLLSLASKRDAIEAKIKTAQDNLKSLQDARADVVKGIADTLNQMRNITSFDFAGAIPSATAINAKLEANLATLQAFNGKLQQLQKMGFNAEIIQQIAQAGPESAGALADALIKARPDQIKSINDAFKSIGVASNAAGDTIAGQMYDAGIKAAQGLIKGLQSQEAAIVKQMSKLADAIVKAIKKTLGIKSPSTVFHSIGQNTVQGLINGMSSMMPALKSEFDNVASVMTPQNGTGTGYYTPSVLPAVAQQPTNVTKTNYVNVTVNTQEIDPRKTSSALAWELVGQL